MTKDKAISQIKKQIITVLLIFGSIIPLPALSDQFGLRMGESLSSITAKGISLKPTGTSNTYKATSLPLGNKMFDDYRLFIVKGVGLCKIFAWLPDIKDSAYGDRTQAKFGELYEMLTSKYGPSNKHDFLRSGSIWNSANEWVMSLTQKDRYLTTFWMDKYGSSLPSDMGGIKLEAFGVNSQRTLISIVHEFKNIDRCNAVDKNETGSNL